MRTRNDSVSARAALSRGGLRALCFAAAFLLWPSAPPPCGSAPPGTPAGAAQDGPEEETKNDKRKRTRLPPEASVVKKHLADYLHPTRIKFLKGGRVKLVFNFAEKSEHHERIFMPPIRAGITEPFRWSQEGEEAFVGSERGIRISDEGFALLDCWFLDDVEAQIELLQHINYTSRMYAAITFNNERGYGLGSNYGTQCAMFKNGRLAKKGGGKAAGVPFNVKAKLVLVVKDGVAEARKGSSSRPRDRMRYSAKSYSSGRIGISWGGSMSATITSLEVTGKVDIPAMAKLLKRKLKVE